MDKVLLDVLFAALLAAAASELKASELPVSEVLSAVPGCRPISVIS